MRHSDASNLLDDLLDFFDDFDLYNLLNGDVTIDNLKTPPFSYWDSVPIVELGTKCDN